MASDGPPETERATPETAATDGHDRRPRRPTLASRTVRRPDGPDRTTVYPADASGVPRMSTWISVDANCVVDLEALR
jgi:hypothetical protein